MRRAVVAVVASLVAASASITAQGPRQIQVYASVLDALGEPVLRLTPEDLRLMEDGTEVTVTSVERVNRPVKLQVLLDNGVGLGQTNIPLLKTGITGMLEALPEDLDVTMVTTAPQPRFVARASTERAAWRKGLALLAGDDGAGRFVESLNEATRRIERDETDFFPVIVMVATTSGDRNARDADAVQIMRRLEARPTTVHVVVFSGGPRGSHGGAVQTNFGLTVTGFTGGRYEAINSATRLPALLLEIGEQMATVVERQSRLFRVTAERPARASGPLGRISASIRAPLTLAGLSFDGHFR